VSGGLESALRSLGLKDLRGKPAAEVVAQVAEQTHSNTLDTAKTIKCKDS
jgi:hypothetical protein